jgi:ATP-dependent protease Clp ATPase subunit
LLDVMYEIPSQTNSKKGIVNEDVVQARCPPEIVHGKTAVLA